LSNAGREIPFCTAVTLKVWRRACGLTFRLMLARFAIACTARWIVRTPDAKVVMDGEVPLGATVARRR